MGEGVLTGVVGGEMGNVQLNLFSTKFYKQFHNDVLTVFCVTVLTQCVRMYISSECRDLAKVS